MLVVGAFVGGFVNGLAGFGTALFALGFFLSVMPPREAVAIIVVISVFAGALGLQAVYPHIKPHKSAIFRITIPGVIGVPFGVVALSFVSVDILKLLVAFMLLLYGGYFTARANLPQLAGHFPKFDMLIGLIGGLLGGLAALSGALPTMWLAMRDMDKQTTRTILQCYNLTLLSVTTALLWANGAYAGTTIIHTLIAVPVAMIAARFGLALFKRLNTAQFRRLLVAMTFISGLIMLFRIFT